MLSIFVLLLPLYVARAQVDFSHFELNVGIGGEAYFASEEFMMGVMDVWYYGPESISAMYRNCYDVQISPTLSLGWAYNIHDRLAVVGSFGFNRVSAQYFNPFTNEETSRETCYRFDILVGARFNWVYYREAACYSQLQIGGTFHTPGDYWSRNELSQGHLGFQVTALGLRWGSNLFCFGEWGWGTEYFAFFLITGIRIGVGYKF